MPLDGDGTMVGDKVTIVLAPWAQTEDEMEAWDAIRARRNVRQYQPEPVSEADLNRIAEAGWRAPSAKNRQAWDFVIVTDKAQLQELRRSGRAPVISPVPRPPSHSSCRYRPVNAGR